MICRMDTLARHPRHLAENIHKQVLFCRQSTFAFRVQLAETK